jgi:hypothetical protein
MLSLAKRFLISDNGLRKICERMDVPVPKNGHWMRLQYNKPADMTALPETERAEQTIELELREEGDNTTTTSPLQKLAKQITVPADSFDKPDPLIIIAKQRLKGNDARAYQFEGMVQCKGDEHDIRVSPAYTDRALRFMDALIKTLRTRQHDIIFRSEETYALVKGDNIKIKFHELTKRVVINDRDWGNSELRPTGLLCCKTGSFTPKEWKDSAKDPDRRVENMIPEIVAWLEMEADRWNEARADSQRDIDAREKIEQIKKDAEERKQAEQAAFEKLLSDSQRWNQSKLLRDYIAEAARRSADPAWIEWASKKADWFDPFIKLEDELLGEYKILHAPQHS